MIRTRAHALGLLLAAVGALGACGGEDTPQRPDNPMVTIRFLGPDGEPFTPRHVSLSELKPFGEHSMSWNLNAWGGDVYTDEGDVQLVPGERYALLLASWTEGVFDATTIYFVAREGPIDLGTIDLRLHGFSVISPADGITATAYPIDFAWTPYANPAFAQATYEMSLWGYGGARGSVTMRPSLSTAFRLEATDAERLGSREARWKVYVWLSTPEGFEVQHISKPFVLKLP